MSRFEQYQNKYQHAQLERREGIVEVTFHTGGKEMIWAQDSRDRVASLRYFSGCKYMNNRIGDWRLVRLGF